MTNTERLLLTNNELNCLKRDFADLTPVQKDLILKLKNDVERFVKINKQSAIVAMSFVLLNISIDELGEAVKAEQKEQETKNNSSMH